MWTDLTAWLHTPVGAQILYGGVVPFAAIVGAGAVAALILHAATRRLLGQADREVVTGTIAATVEAARRAASAQHRNPAARYAADRLAVEADVRLRLLHLIGAPQAADWAAARIESLRGGGASGRDTKTQVDALRDGLVAWARAPKRAPQIFAASRTEVPSPTRPPTPKGGADAADAATPQSRGETERPETQPAAASPAEGTPGAGSTPVAGPTSDPASPQRSTTQPRWAGRSEGRETSAIAAEAPSGAPSAAASSDSSTEGAPVKAAPAPAPEQSVAPAATAPAAAPIGGQSVEDPPAAGDRAARTPEPSDPTAAAAGSEAVPSAAAPPKAQVKGAEDAIDAPATAASTPASDKPAASSGPHGLRPHRRVSVILPITAPIAQPPIAVTPAVHARHAQPEDQAEAGGRTPGPMRTPPPEPPAGGEPRVAPPTAIPAWLDTYDDTADEDESEETPPPRAAATFDRREPGDVMLPRQ